MTYIFFSPTFFSSPSPLDNPQTLDSLLNSHSIVPPPRDERKQQFFATRMFSVLTPLQTPPLHHHHRFAAPRKRVKSVNSFCLPHDRLINITSTLFFRTPLPPPRYHTFEKTFLRLHDSPAFPAQMVLIRGKGLKMRKTKTKIE